MRVFILHTLFRLLLLLVPLSLATSASAGADATISSGKPLAIVNLQFSPDGLILVPILINGKGPFLFMLDSGAERNAIDDSVVKTLGLKTRGKFQVRGYGPQKVDATQTENTTILIGLASQPDFIGNAFLSKYIGNASLSGQKFMMMDLSRINGGLGVKVQGILGANVFKDFVVKIDYTGNTLSLILPGAFAYQGSGIVLPLVFSKSNCPRIDGKVAGIAGTFDLDTGDTDGLILYSPFVEKNHLRQWFGPDLPTNTSVGVGGKFQTQTTSPLHLELGRLTMTGQATLSEDSSGQTGVKDAVGSIGNSILSNMTVTFDYSRKRIILEPPSGMTDTTQK